MYSVGNYTFFAGDMFTLSGRRDTYIYIRSGQIQLYSPAANFNKYAYPSDRPILIRAGAMITGIADGSSIRVEFDAASH
jgi:hypothetical protein